MNRLLLISLVLAGCGVDRVAMEPAAAVSQPVIDFWVRCGVFKCTGSPNSIVGPKSANAADACANLNTLCVGQCVEPVGTCLDNRGLDMGLCPIGQ